MEKYFDIIKKSMLFDGISEKEYAGLLKCLGAACLHFSKNETVLQEGEAAGHIGLVLSGCVEVVQEDYYGNHNIMTIIKPGQLFAEVFACALAGKLPVSVVTVCESEIMLLDCKRIIYTCENACEFHHHLTRNLLRIVAGKTLLLNQKIEIISKRTTREKLLAYLQLQAKENGRDSFIIPYDRQGLADYLGVDRSAMSAELSRLKREGRIEYKKSCFTLRKPHS